jgi:hypothetical protein
MMVIDGFLSQPIEFFNTSKLIFDAFTYGMFADYDIPYIHWMLGKFVFLIVVFAIGIWIGYAMKRSKKQ